MAKFPSNLSNAQTQMLLSMAAKQLGKSPETLRRQVQSGDTAALLTGLDAQQKKQAAAVLSDPAAMQRFLQDPQVKNLLNSLAKGGKA